MGMWLVKDSSQILTITGTYESFDTLTRKSLQHAVLEAGCHLSDDALQDVINSYDRLNVLVRFLWFSLCAELRGFQIR